MVGNIKDYKLSIFNLYLDLEGNRIGIYNTLHDSALVLTESIFEKLKKKKDNIEKDVLEKLLSNRAIYHNEFDEKIYYRYFLNKMKYSPHSVTFMISLTSDCNLCCEYCFEGSTKENKYMSEKVALNTVKYIKNALEKNPGIKCADIVFFGGEPLLNKKIMRLICEQIAGIEDLRSKIRYSITTNLTLLKDSDITFMKRFGFSNIQVAIDGPQSVHDKRRFFKSGKGSFNIIFENLGRLKNNDIFTILILNYDKGNWHRYRGFLKFIKEHLFYDKAEFILNPIARSLCGSTCDKLYMTSAEETEIFLKLFKALKKEGLPIRALGQTNMLCMLNTDISCLIDPEGDIYKCPIMLGDTRYRTGNIESELFYNFNYAMLLNNVWQGCLDNNCAYLPICGGGCRALALINNGDLDSIYCQKEDYFGNTYKVIMKDYVMSLIEGGEDYVE